MISSVEIINFQGHAYTYIEFGSGVNVFKGQSHKGKSSIIRALKWALFNTPRGEGFKASFAKEEDPVEVTISFTDGDFIRRKKIGTKNTYETEEHCNENILNAVGSDVPDEVKEVTQISEVNFQSQEDSYFLLQDTPGKVGRKISEVVGLQIIAESKKKIDEVANKTATRLKVNKEDTKSTIENLRDFEHLEDVEEIVTSIETSLKRKQDKVKRYRGIETVIESIKRLEEEIKTDKKWLEIEEDHSLLVEQQEKLANLRSKHRTISNIVNDIKEAEKYVKSAGSELIQLGKQYAELEKQLDYCQYCGAHKKHWK